MASDRAFLRAKALEVLTKNLNVGLLDVSYTQTPGAEEQIHAELQRMSCMAAKLGDMLHDFPAHDPETGEQSEGGEHSVDEQREYCRSLIARIRERVNISGDLDDIRGALDDEEYDLKWSPLFKGTSEDT